MTDYEHYQETAVNYDRTRSAIGVEIILGCLARGGRPLSEMFMLDAGCGTGNYSSALVDYVKRIEAVDISRGMLDVAAAKMNGYQEKGRIAFHETDLGNLPFEDGLFDAIMVNQVLHHLDTQHNGDCVDWPIIFVSCESSIGCCDLEAFWSSIRVPRNSWSVATGTSVSFQKQPRMLPVDMHRCRCCGRCWLPVDSPAMRPMFRSKPPARAKPILIPAGR
jgi:SAM-dependent methyltransferase